MDVRFLFAAAVVTLNSVALRADDPKPAKTLKLPADVTWMVFTPDSKHLLTADNGRNRVIAENEYELRLWSVETGKQVAGPVSGSGLGASGAISPDGRSAVHRRVGRRVAAVEVAGPDPHFPWAGR
jgi:hypothetical protein